MTDKQSELDAAINTLSALAWWQKDKHDGLDAEEYKSVMSVVEAATAHSKMQKDKCPIPDRSGTHDCCGFERCIERPTSSVSAEEARDALDVLNEAFAEKDNCKSWEYVALAIGEHLETIRKLLNERIGK